MRRRLPILAALALAVPTALAGTAAAGPLGGVTATVEPVLASTLEAEDPATQLLVFVHADDVATARSAAEGAGLLVTDSWDRIGVAVAAGSPAQVVAVSQAPGVTYVERDVPIELYGDTSHVATRGLEARRTLLGADGTALDGSGVSIAVIDSGVDGTHPAFEDPATGASTVVRNLKSVCIGLQLNPASSCFVDVTALNDSDTFSIGGHGTHVAGIAGGQDSTLSDGTVVRGAAPGARLVGLSVGQAVSVYGGNTGLNWVLENHAAPCGTGVSAAQCPPIRVTNNSYGPVGGGSFDPNSATAKLQRALVAEGVVTVWAAGNDGGDGSESRTNPAGQDPTGGILSVAAYDDRGTGTRDGETGGFSSRGAKGDPATHPDLAAPGVDITAACRIYLPICTTGFDVRDGGDFNTISGTSMAAPHVAGIVAQAFQAAPSASPAQVEDALVSTATRYGSRAPFEQGAGLLDAVRAARAVGASG
jgi:serine protease AprX